MINPSKRKIAIVVDPSGGWFDPHAQAMAAELEQRVCAVSLIANQNNVPRGDIAYYLSCEKIAPPTLLARNKVNVVVHASALPHGRGFSPLVWQVLEGKSEIPLTMIEMAPEVDSGHILMEQTLQLKGHELNDEMRTEMGYAIVKMCLEHALAHPLPDGRAQIGEGSWYRRRRPVDSRLDPKKTIIEQFNLLRVVDNERYPAFFDHSGHRYIIKIEDHGAVMKDDIET